MTSYLMSKVKLAKNPKQKKDNLYRPAFIQIKGGDFDMGSDNGAYNEQPVHKVMLDDFSIAETHVTNAQYIEVLNWAQKNKKLLALDDTVMVSGEKLLNLQNERCRISFKTIFTLNNDKYKNHPVTCVTWYGAMAYCYFLNKIDGLDQAIEANNWKTYKNTQGYRLPTEAEWEYASRSALIDNDYPWGNTSPSADCVNFNNIIADTTTVRTYKPYGKLYDMSGNVWEWCNDWHDDEYYTKCVKKNPKGPSVGTERIIRGGCFFDGASNLRCAERGKVSPNVSSYHGGFRPLRTERQ